MTTIPGSATDLTPEWFSAALGREVTSVAVERLGGLLSLVHRASLMYEGEPGPGSVIVKLALPGIPPAPGFDREVRFYRELGPRMDVAVPHALVAEADAATGRYVLVLEDFPDHTARSDDAFATPGELRALVTEVARLHAAWWGSPDLEGHDFLRTLPDFVERVEGQLERGVPLFLERFAGRLGPDERALSEALPSHFRAAVEPLSAAPVTLAHHDLSLRNVLFSNDATSFGAEPTIVLIDWQLTQRVPGVRDLSFLIGCSLPADRRPVEEPGLLALYLAALEAHGVTGYTPAQLLEDYRRSVICDFGRMVMTGGQARLTAGMEAAVAHQLGCRAGSVENLELLALL